MIMIKSNVRESLVAAQEGWEKLRPHKQQSALYRTKHRFPKVAAGRGSGKTAIARRRMIRALAEEVPGNPHPEYFYGLPTFNQAKRVAWRPLKRMIPKEWIKSISESELRITTVFGSELQVLGFDKPMRAEGTQWAGGVIDESSDEPPGLFDLTIRPALTRWNGWCWRIGVPKRFGVGAEDFKTAFDQGLADGSSFHWTSESILTADEIATIKATMNNVDYVEQYLARWEAIAGAIFYAFSEERNVTPRAVYRPDMPIIVGSDFNVDPMCWTLSHKANNGLVVFDELMIRNTNTPETLTELKQRYPNHAAGWEFVGDASGKARKSSAYSSDYLWIVNDERFVPKKVLYLTTNPPLVNRFASCNALLQAADETVRLFINPKCKRLIADLKHRSYKPKTREPNDAHPDMGHMSDALGYTVYRYFPINIVRNEPTRIATKAAT